MAFWLLACKEINGGIYVCRLPKAVDDHTPGIPSPWYYVGPGNRPQVYLYDGANQFILVFDYLSHLSARVLDITTWPPTQVDPIQTTPVITIQQPEDTFLFNPKSDTMASLIEAFPAPPVIQITPVAISGTTYSATITTVPGYYPGPDLHWYRVYRQPIAGGNWTLVRDWQAQTLNYTDSATGSLRFNYRATLGLAYDPNLPNDPTQHFEGIPGNVVSADSSVHPIHNAFLPDEPLSFSITQSTPFASFGDRQNHYVELGTDSLDFASSSGGSSAFTGFWRLTNYIVVSVTTPTYTPPSESISAPISITGQLKNTTTNAVFSARLDQ